MKKTMMFVAVLVVLVSAGAVQAQNLLVNGNFGDGNYNFTGWTSSGHVLITNYDGSVSGSGSAYAAVFNNGNSSANGTLSQSFTTVSGHEYEVIFQYGGYTAANGDSKSGQALGVEEIGSSLIQSNGIVLNSTSEYGVHSAYFTEFNYFFTANSASTTLEFLDESPSPNSANGVLGDVSVIAVPEPSTLAMSAVGGLFSVLALRCRK